MRIKSCERQTKKIEGCGDGDLTLPQELMRRSDYLYNMHMDLEKWMVYVNREEILLNRFQDVGLLH